MDKSDRPKTNELELRKNSSSIPEFKTLRKAEIRFLNRGDVEAVAEMSAKYFPHSKNVTLKYFRKTVEELYFNKDYTHPGINSLVSVSEEGVVNGFLGITTNTFQFNGRAILVANCHHLMASQTARAQLIPMRMLQQFLAGPQDLSFADGSSESTRLLWKRLGGEPSIGDSLYYKVPLRPFSFAARPLLKSLYRPVRDIVSLLPWGVDKAAGLMRLPFFNRKKPPLQFEYLSPALLLKGLSLIQKQYSVFPEYNIPKIEWIYRLLESKKQWGILHKSALMDSNKNMIGWFIYYAKKRGVCEVIQAVSIPGKEGELFEALTWHAYKKGGIELSGRLMRSQLQSEFATRSVCMPARMWTLIHSSDAELKREIQSGNAYLTRFEGDLWLL